MKRRDLLRHLSSHGCALLREGGSHSWWHNPSLHTIADYRRGALGLEVILGQKITEAWGQQVAVRAAHTLLLPRPMNREIAV